MPPTLSWHSWPSPDPHLTHAWPSPDLVLDVSLLINFNFEWYFMSLLSKLLFIVTVIYAVFQAPTLRLQMPCIVLKMLQMIQECSGVLLKVCYTWFFVCKMKFENSGQVWTKTDKQILALLGLLPQPKKMSLGCVMLDFPNLPNKDEWWA